MTKEDMLMANLSRTAIAVSAMQATDSMLTFLRQVVVWDPAKVVDKGSTQAILAVFPNR
jgi:hypothetical protein